MKREHQRTQADLVRTPINNRDLEAVALRWASLAKKVKQLEEQTQLLTPMQLLIIFP